MTQTPFAQQAAGHRLESLSARLLVFPLPKGEESEESKERQNKVWAESPGVAVGIKDTGANSCEKEQQEKITAKK